MIKCKTRTTTGNESETESETVQETTMSGGDEGEDDGGGEGDDGFSSDIILLSNRYQPHSHFLDFFRSAIVNSPIDT